jgi:hypothetical protein
MGKRRVKPMTGLRGAAHHPRLWLTIVAVANSVVLD